MVDDHTQANVVCLSLESSQRTGRLRGKKVSHTSCVLELGKLYIRLSSSEGICPEMSNSMEIRNTAPTVRMLLLMRSAG